jgi:hypothetical protein
LKKSQQLKQNKNSKIEQNIKERQTSRKTKEKKKKHKNTQEKM